VSISKILQELPCWNLLSRSKGWFPHVDARVRVLWLIGACVRFVLIFPVRVALLVAALIWLGVGALALRYIEGMRLLLFIIYCLVEEKRRKQTADWISLVGFRLMSKAVSMLARYHNREENKVVIINHK
jgi:hypothetical protein